MTGHAVRSVPLRALALVSLLAVAACSSKSDAPPSPTPNDTAETTPAPEPAPSAKPSPSASHELRDTHSIPPLLRGRWGLVKADCTRPRGDAKGLLTIRTDELEFYEAMARLDSVSAIAPGAITGRFAFEGEGQSWSLDVTLRTSDQGRTLVRTDRGPDAAPTPLTYTRCL